MPGAHAYLSPSSAKQWLSCTPSVKLEQNFPEKGESEAAKEGTLAHSIAEQKLNKWINRKRNKIVCEDKDMDTYTDGYRDYVIEVYNRVKKDCTDPVFKIEQKLDLKEWIKEDGGTADAIIIGDGSLHIIDLKYGKGVAVSAKNNPQIRLYALGAIREYQLLYDLTKVHMHIYQPRVSDGISEEVMQVDDLINWGEEVVKPAAEQAFEGVGEYHPSEETCRWCRAKGACKARAEHNEHLRRYGFMDPDLLNNEEIGKILAGVDELTRWATDVKEYALDAMLKGAQIPGFKVVEGRSIRKVTDEKLLVDNMKDAGYEEALLYEKKLHSVTKLEKLAGKKDFAIISAGCIEKPKGSPAIAPMSDKRPEYNSGADDFKEELKVVPS